MRKRNRFLMDGRLGRTCDERMLPNIKEVIAEAQRRVDQLHSIYGDTAQLGSFVSNLPGVGFNSVVHCKDCGYYEIGEDNLPYCHHHYSGRTEHPQPDDFCSYGKRKWRDDKNES